MSPAKSSQHGFSLLELLVVFLILTLVSSLVVPQVTSLYRKHQVNTEIILLQKYIQKISVVAFTKDVSLTLKFDNSVITVQKINNEFDEGKAPDYLDGADEQKKFNHLKFPLQRINVHHTGTLSAYEVVMFNTQGLESTLKLHSMVQY